MRHTLAATLFAFPTLLFAQKLPHHDVLLFSLTRTGEGSYGLIAPQFLTAFNPDGYNNQLINPFGG